MTTTAAAAKGTRREPIKKTVRRLRIAAGLSQAALARETSVSRSLICEIEAGSRKLTPATRQKLAACLPDLTETAA